MIIIIIIIIIKVTAAWHVRGCSARAGLLVTIIGMFAHIW